METSLAQEGSLQLCNALFSSGGAPKPTGASPSILVSPPGLGWPKGLHMNTRHMAETSVLPSRLPQAYVSTLIAEEVLMSSLLEQSRC